MKLSVTLGKIRTESGISQEKLAELMGVSRQAVQKWESGAATPDLDNLMKLSRYFNISLDKLIFDSDRRESEEMTLNRKICPEYQTEYWANYANDLICELTQSKDEGKDLEQYEDLFRATSKLPGGDAKARIADVLFDIVQNAPLRKNFQYNEPSDITTIRLLRPEKRTEMKAPDTEGLYDKIHGAWVGRICGCLLGKPVESMRTNELIPLLTETGNYPMHRYIMASEITEEMYDKFTFRLRGKCFGDSVNFMPVDDDTNYTVLAHLLIERYGRNFTPSDVASLWTETQPQSSYCTAERVAFRNFYANYKPPYSAMYKNPYREYIGAQIRGDYFGYINPGNPEAAADMAWRDASISHIKNGIYGEMFASAMIAAAAVCDDTKKIIRAGLEQIPENCRLSEKVNKIIEMFENKSTSKECFAYIHKCYDEYTEYGWCHTVPNAMIVAASLLYGGGDYTRSICLAVQTGFDTDCNGATVGSIVGMQKGFGAIPKEWYEPINDTLNTSIFGVGKVSISEMAKKTLDTVLGK